MERRLQLLLFTVMSGRVIHVMQVRQFIILFFFFFFFFFFCFLGPNPRHMEGPRLGVKSELQLPASTTATAMPDLSCIHDIHHSSRQQCWILNPLREARDQTHNLKVPSWIHFSCATTGTPVVPYSETPFIHQQHEGNNSTYIVVVEINVLMYLGQCLACGKLLIHFSYQYYLLDSTC